MNALAELPDAGLAVTPSPSAAGEPYRPRRRHILPGFPLTLGFAIFYLSAIVLIPLGALVLKCITPTTDYPTVPAVVQHVVESATSERALNSYKLSFGLSFAAALLNAVFGFVAAWALTRYQFPGRKFVDALVDLPFAMPTSVAGLALTQVFSTNGGYIGELLYHWFGWRIAYTSWGILIALTFIGFPFVVRTLQPVLASLVAEVEEAAACLGANRWQTFRRVIFPAVRPALLTGVMLAFGRGVGEYGSIVFIGGMMPFRNEITPQLIIVKLEEFDYVGAAGIGLAMLLLSFAIVMSVNALQYFANRRGRTA
jgi:sulfate transport system permease protein